MYNLIGDFMKSIDKNSTSTLIIQKSKFITELIKVNFKEEIDLELENIKNKYKGATHYCYAYIIENNKRFNDDGEPSGTAGMPILNVLENNDLNYILCVVIRYFGGIKLGAGGLVRAYTKAVTTGLENNTIKEIEPGYKIKITFSYENNKIIDNLLKEETIQKEFNETIEYTFLIRSNHYEEIKLMLEQYTIKSEILENIML